MENEWSKDKKEAEGTYQDNIESLTILQQDDDPVLFFNRYINNSRRIDHTKVLRMTNNNAGVSHFHVYKNSVI